MSVSESVQTTAKASSNTSSGLVLQRKCACGGSAGFSGECGSCRSNKLLGRPLQRKLAISEPGDRYEQEADRIANQVMASPRSDAVTATPVKVQRFTGSPSGQPTEVPASVERVLASPGQPLERGLREDMEARFGHDFSHIRVHTDDAASQSAAEVDASAYTVGNRLVFARGTYAPTTSVGKRLLAHELTHVIQQSRIPFDGGMVGGHQLRGLMVFRQAGHGVGTSLVPPGEEICMVPSWLLDDDDSSEFGRMVEEPVFADFCRLSSCTRWSGVGSGGDTFFDEDSPRPSENYLDFIEDNNGTYFRTSEAFEHLHHAFEDRGWNPRRPDVLYGRGGARRFYELKPASSFGRAAGQQKIIELNVLFDEIFDRRSDPAAEGRGYRPGTTYPPGAQRDIDLNNERVFLRVEREEPALLTYKVCFRNNSRRRVEETYARDQIRRYLENELGYHDLEGDLAETGESHPSPTDEELEGPHFPIPVSLEIGEGRPPRGPSDRPPPSGPSNPAGRTSEPDSDPDGDLDEIPERIPPPPPATRPPSGIGISPREGDGGGLDAIPGLELGRESEPGSEEEPLPVAPRTPVEEGIQAIVNFIRQIVARGILGYEHIASTARQFFEQHPDLVQIFSILGPLAIAAFLGLHAFGQQVWNDMLVWITGIMEWAALGLMRFHF